MNQEPVARTPGVIAREVDESLSRVLYVLNTRMHIRPIGRAGMLRLYNEQAVRQVRHELNAIAAKREAQRQDATVPAE